MRSSTGGSPDGIRADRARRVVGRHARARRPSSRRCPADFEIPVVVAQHRPPAGATSCSSSVLARSTKLDVVAAHDKEPLRPGPRVRGPGRLPPARRARPPRAQHRRPRPVRAALDRRAVRVGRGRVRRHAPSACCSPASTRTAPTASRGSRRPAASRSRRTRRRRSGPRCRRPRSSAARRGGCSSSTGSARFLAGLRSRRGERRHRMSAAGPREGAARRRPGREPRRARGGARAARPDARPRARRATRRSDTCSATSSP